jgi:hypothetical protein
MKAPFYHVKIAKNKTCNFTLYLKDSSNSPMKAALIVLYIYIFDYEVLKYVYWYSGFNVKKDIKGSFLILVGCPGIGQ